jgi:YspA, cpYpsA-related SLOG family
MEKILVCGDRNWSNYWIIHDVLSKLDRNTTIIAGHARGADIMAETIAAELGMKVISIPANWEKYGKRAGPIRNRMMLDLEPDLVIAFHNNLEESKGTKDTVNEARNRGIKTEIYSEINNES